MAKTDLSMSPGSPSPDDKVPPESDPSVTADTDQDMERRESHKAAGPSQAATEGGSKDGEGSLREYRNDLEYLEDSFKLLIILLRYVNLTPFVCCTNAQAVTHQAQELIMVSHQFLNEGT